MAKLTIEEVSERICDKICLDLECTMYRHELDVYKLAEFLAEYLPEKEVEEMPGFEGTREDLAKISIN